MSYLHFTALALTAGALAVAGCGGSSKGGATTAASGPTQAVSTGAASTATVKLASGKPLSRAEWIVRGDAICAPANKRRAINTVKSSLEIVPVLRRLAVYDKTEATELGQLAPPPSKSGDWRQIVYGLQLLGQYTVKAAEYAPSDPSAVSPLLAKSNQAYAQLAAIAKRDGFKFCSVPGL